MAKLKEILEAEAQRATLEQCREIHLFPEGTFYRAYEWSAWLCVRYIQDFKPTKRKFKSEDVPSVFIGFPVSSLQRYTPDDATVTVAEDKSVKLLLPEGVFQGVSDVSQLQTDFENWKDSVPLAESSKKESDGGKAGSTGQRPGRLTDVMHLILAYPIEQKSPLESMQFLADIKKSIAEII
ncbi:MAG: hypothetical protein IJ549_00590 [Prevotella sp.]|nr:hypothetical protein [Prevotella sp.]